MGRLPLSRSEANFDRQGVTHLYQHMYIIWPWGIPLGECRDEERDYALVQDRRFEAAADRAAPLSRM